MIGCRAWASPGSNVGCSPEQSNKTAAKGVLTVISNVMSVPTAVTSVDVKSNIEETIQKLRGMTSALEVDIRYLYCGESLVDWMAIRNEPQMMDDFKSGRLIPVFP